MKLMNSEHQINNQSKCLWMQAGVIRKKICLEDYNCPECRFNTILSRLADENDQMARSQRLSRGTRGRILPWKKRLRNLPISRRPCVHHMKGRIEFRTCTHDYQCNNCDFDQYFHDQYTVYTTISPVDLLNVKGIKVPQGYYFHKGHMWAKIEEGSGVRVGADDFALRLLGPPDRIEAPLMGKEVRQGRPSIKFIRGENKAKLLSPIGGVVTSINPRLRESGRLANEDPYSDGWIMKIEPDRLRQDLANLMINEETDSFMENEVHHLYQVIEETSGPMSTDGGTLIQDIYGNMPELGWERLTKEFLLK